MSATEGSSTGVLARVSRDAVAVLTSDVLNKATTFVVYALLARYTDTRSFGQLSLGLLLLYTFQVFARGGMPTLITRDLATKRSRTPRYITAGMLVVGISSVLTTVAMIGFVWALNYPADTRLVVTVLSLGLAPYALSFVSEAIFRGWQRMHYIAYANVPANVLKVVGAYLLLDAGYGVVAIAALLVACRVAILVVEWALLVTCIARPARRIDWGYAKRLASRGLTFFGIDGLIAVWSSLDVVLLSKLCGETEAGLFAAAWQLLLPAKLFFQSVVTSVFPVMCQKVGTNLKDLKAFVRWLVEFLMLIGFPTGIAIYFLAEPGLLLMYGDKQFLASADVVRVLVFVLFLHVLTSVLGHALWAGMKERITLRIVIVDLVVNIVASYFLIQAYGLIGAAYGSLLAWVVNGLQHYLACSKLFTGMHLAGMVWRALAAGTAMVVCFTALQSTNQILAASAAVLCYLGVMSLLMLTTYGGLRGLRQDYFAPLVK